MTRIDLLGVPTDAQTFDAALDTLSTWAANANGRRYVCTCPVYTLMVCREQPAAMRAVAGADMVTADGMPIVWLQRRLGYPAERVYGPDILLALCERGLATGVRHYFWGGAPGVPERLADALKARFPTLQIAGTHAPPRADIGAAPDADAIRSLNAARADIIWVGLGSPKQDRWMALHRPYLDAPLLIGVGAAFDMLSGGVRQAPRWMQRAGLEWLFRLAQEPRRLAKRYLVYNPRFIWLVLRTYGLRQG
ncbi:MAG: WecB/TagA/CpsF family glycosyltransferase [Chloroflexota bacterium]|nr:WecB/TagA/CpsF family glycosyltransferase [Chloroflexota bacterium]